MKNKDKMAEKKKVKQAVPKNPHLSLILVVAATFVAFYPSIGNDFVNWDDVVYIMNNDMIRKLSFENLSKMFSTFWMGNYHPFTLLSFAFDYSIFNLSSGGYHFHNLVLHIVNAVLVYFVTWHLFKKNNLMAFIVSMLFAIHPMHVESVAWISERKDLLYTMYFLLSMLAYIFYNQTGKNKYLVLALVGFVFSLLSKAQAVTLPVVLLLMDYYFGRKPNLKLFLEKVPFFALSLIFGIVAIMAQKADDSINPVGISLVNSLFYAQYSIWVYLYKLVLPINLTCLYNYPFTDDGGIPFYIYLSPTILVLIAVVLFVTYKKHREIFFGSLFFLVVIFPVLQFLPVGQAIVAERYSYIPYIGLFVVVAVLFKRFREQLKTTGNRSLLNYFGIGVLILFGILTMNRTKVWADSVSLWTDVMDKNPKCLAAYVNRSYMNIQYKNYDKVIADCDKGLAIDSTHYKLYINKGTAVRHVGMYEEAVKEFTTTIRINPQSYDSYLDRGIIYTDNLNQVRKGISDFRYFLKYRPENKNGNYNLAVAYYKLQEYDSALYYCNRTIELANDFAGAYYISAIVYDVRQDFPKAYEFGSKAQTLGYSIDPALLEKWRKNANVVVPNF
jgi:hypothetical protein